MTKFAVNSFQVPNSLVDLQLSSMSGNALKCLLYIIRKTRGFHKETDRIAASQFIKSCGIAKNTVLSALIELEGLGLIKKDKAKKQNGWNTYSLTSLFDEGEVNKLKVKNGGSKNEPVQKLNCAENEPNGAKFEPQGSSKIEPTKNNTKNNIQKTENEPVTALKVEWPEFICNHERTKIGLYLQRLKMSECAITPQNILDEMEGNRQRGAHIKNAVAYARTLIDQAVVGRLILNLTAKKQSQHQSTNLTPQNNPNSSYEKFSDIFEKLYNNKKVTQARKGV